MRRKILAIAVLALSAVGCSARDRADSCASAIVYFKEHRTGLCFADHGGSIATVDCEKVEKFLVNDR